MTILQSDIKLVKSQVMDDVPEGGGPPSSAVVIDGASNEIFADVSNSDRVIGRVSARKVHLSIQSHDTDTYLGANLLVATPPNDPNVSITIFAGTVFETRAQAINRLEAYLGTGVNYAGFLYGNHIQGQRSLQILQRTDELPPIGGTLVLTKLEGFSGEYKQYVRITEATVVLRTFTDAQGDYTRYVLTLKLSDPLLVDFAGFDVTRAEPTKAQTALATKISESIVTDAAKYQGVVELEEEALIGDFTIKAETIFTQLVPSAQIETAIADARTNQVSAVPVAVGGPISRTVTMVVANAGTGSGYIGGAILPGTLRGAPNWGAIHTDKNGVIYDQTGTALGTVDYENGLVTYTAGIGNSGSVAIPYTYTPAAVPPTVNESMGFTITTENRSQVFVRTLASPPTPGTLNVSYSVAGRWYVLRDDGTGALRGATSAYGAGVVNFATGTVSVTLGALPDVDSAVIFQWVNATVTETNNVSILAGGKFFWPVNSTGNVSLTNGSEAIKPGTVTISWTVGSLRTLTDNGAGLLTGYGTGFVNYAKGTIMLQPESLPPKGTIISVSFNRTAKVASTVSVASGSGSFGTTNIKPGSISLVVPGQLRGQYLGNSIVNWGAASSYRLVDDGVGGLDALIGNTRVHVGTVNYAAGTFLLTANTVVPFASAAQVVAYDNVFIADDNVLGMFTST